MKAMEKNITANDYRSILNFFKVISELRIKEEELRNYIIMVRPHRLEFRHWVRFVVLTSCSNDA